MDWLAIEKLDRELHLDQARGFTGNTVQLAGTYAGRPFRLYVIDRAREDDIQSHSPFLNDTHSLTLDGGLRIVASLENPRPVGLRLADRGDILNPVRHALQWLLRRDQEEQFQARFELEIWPDQFNNHFLASVARRGIMMTLLRMPSPIRVELGHSSLSLSSPHQLDPQRALPLLQAAVALAEVLESISKVDIVG
jgi:hypothetical protein